MRKELRNQRKRALWSAAVGAIAGVCALQSPSLAAVNNFEWNGATNSLWDLSSANWNNITIPQPGVAWSNNADPTTPNGAFFLATPTPGTVTVDANIDLSALGFAASGWTIAGGTGDLSFGANGGTIAISTVGDNTIGATIVDRTLATAISVANAGVLTLTGTNTYSGGTTLNTGGILAIDDLARVGGGNIDFNGGWLRVNGTTLTSVDSRIAASETTARFIINDAANVFTMNAPLAAGAGVLFAKGPGVLVVSGQNLNTGATDLSTQAIMRLAGGDNRLNPVANIGIFEGSTLDLNGNNQEVSRLDGDATGIVTNTAAATTRTLTIGGAAGATYAGHVNDGAGAGVVAVAKNGTATQTMTGTSSYTGGTTINAGTLSVNSDAALGAGVSAVTLNGGTLSSTTGFEMAAARNITLGAGGGTLSNAVVDTVLGVNGVVSGGDLARTTFAGAIALKNSNTYTGLTTINGVLSSAGDDFNSLRGGIIVAANDALGSTAGGTNINANGWLGFQGGINYSSPEPITIVGGGQITGVIRSISGNNTFAGPIGAGANVLNIGVDADSLSLTGALSGSAGLTKVGAGTLILSTPQTYTGGTTIRLQNDFGSGRAVSTPGGTLKLVGEAILTSATTVGAAGTLLIDSAANDATARARVTSLTMGNNAKLTVKGGAVNATTDSFGALSLNNGGGEAFVEINPGTGQTAIAGFASLFRDTLQNSSAAGGTINFRGPNFGTGVGTNEARATFATAPSATQLRVATITDTATGLTRFATNGANGIRQFLDTEYNAGAGTSGGLNNGNVRLTPGTTTITGDATVSSVTLEGNGVTVTGGFNLRSGTTNGMNAMLSTGAGNVISTATLDFGSTSATAVNEGIIYVDGDLTINSVIRNTGGTAPHMAITKSGPGELVLAGDNSFITTEVTANRLLRINNGTVSFNSTGVDANGVANGTPKNLGQITAGTPGGRISLFSGGGLRLKGENLGTVFVPQAISIGNASATGVDGEAAFIQVDAGSTLKTPGISQRSGNGPGGFTKKGAGTLLLSGGIASGVTFDRTGTGKSYLAEGTLTLSGDATNYGGLQSSGWLVASPGTTINFDSTARPTGNSNRLGAVQFASTRLNLTGNSLNATTDQLGTFVFAAGGSAIAITQGSGQTTTLNATNSAGSVRRYQGGTVVISGAGLGTAAAGVARVTASGTFNGANIGGVIPYALADTTVGGNGTAFAVYGGNGITAVTTNTSSVAAGGNARLTSSNNVAGTVNSLHLDGSGVSAGAGTLRVTSGGVLSTGGANSIAATTLAFGNAEGIIHAVSNLSISSDITGSAGLTKAGPGQLTLTGNNTYANGTHVNGGTLLVNNTAGSGTGGGFVSVNAGTIGGTGSVAGSLSISGLANVAPGSGGAGTLTAGALTLASGAGFNYDLADTTTAGGGVNDLLVVASGATANAKSTDVFTLNINAAAGTLGSGDYLLIDSTASLAGGIDPARWVIGSNNATDANTYAFALNGSGDLVLNVTPIGPVVSVWDKDDSISNWSAATSWVGGVPNAAGATATFGAKITAPQTVNVDGTQTVQTINFQNANAYTVAPASGGGGGGAIVIDGPNDGAINVIDGSHSITAPLTLAKNTSFTVTPAASTLSVSDLTATGMNVTKAGLGTLVVNHVRSNTLAVADGTLKMAPDSSAAGVSKVANVSIAAGARLDLSRNKLITDTPAGTFTGGAYTGVQGEVARAYNFGAWDLPGLMTSEADAGPLVGLTTIGVASAEQILFLAPTATGTFAGQTVTGASTIAMYTYAGDLNFDGLVDGGDYGVIDNSFQFPGTDGYSNGDFNYDGIIDGGDYGIIDNTFSLQGAPIPVEGGVAATSLSGVTAVPEPASLSVIAVAAAAGMLGRRRRRRS